MDNHNIVCICHMSKHKLSCHKLIEKGNLFSMRRYRVYIENKISISNRVIQLDTPERVYQIYQE